jgi:GTP-binding protein Era
MNDLETENPFGDVPEGHRSGVIAVAGRPNVGKSTLINALLGQKIAAVSPKPQTTRRQQLGIYTQDDAQILFVDTPGLHLPRHKFGEYMNDVATRALRDSDFVVWVVDASEQPGDGEKTIAETLKAMNVPVILVLNKMDRLSPNTDLSVFDAMVEATETHRVSALSEKGVPELLAALLARITEGPRLYPEDQVSEFNLRQIATEVIREKVLLLTEEEVPHASAVEIDEYRERDNGVHVITATIYVERDSQRGILIGKAGSMIKKIGTYARREMSEIVEAPVFLELHVSVLKNWRSDPRLLARFGYKMSKDDDEK